MGEGHPRSQFVTQWLVFEAMLEAGEPFANLEELIDRAPVDDDERAALWLAAWARASRRSEKRHLTLVGRPT